MQNREKSLIFVVDDEEIIASTIAAILRLQGMDAVPFIHSSDALQTSRATVPDLLISDVMMPELSGPDLAEQIQARHPGCKVILFSGQWDVADAMMAPYEARLVYQMIPKPVHPRELLQKVCEMLDTSVVAPATGENRARLRTAANMRETVADVRADIANTMARKRSVRRRTAHHGLE